MGNKHPSGQSIEANPLGCDQPGTPSRRKHAGFCRSHAHQVDILATLSERLLEREGLIALSPDGPWGRSRHEAPVIRSDIRCVGTCARERAGDRERSAEGEGGEGEGPASNVPTMVLLILLADSSRLLSRSGEKHPPLTFLPRSALGLHAGPPLPGHMIQVVLR